MCKTVALAGGFLAVAAAFIAIPPAASATPFHPVGVSVTDCQNGGGRVVKDYYFRLVCEGGTYNGEYINP